MGKKKSEGEEPQLSEAFSNLFTAGNPFRRIQEQKPDESKKRKAEKNTKNNPIPTPIDELPKKRKKKGIDVEEEEEEEEGVVIGSPRKKRKRDEIAEDVEEISQDGVEVGRKRKVEVKGKEIVVRKEVFDDESKLLRTVFVGNLSLKTKRKVLLKEFEEFGEIESVRIRSVPIVDSKAPRKTLVIKGQVNDAIDRVHAYLVFKDEKSAQSALSHNMAVIGGNHIRVDKACPPRKKLKGEAPIYSVKKTVFVGNLPYDVKDEEIYQLFCGDNQLESNVEAVRVIRDPHTSQGKGIAYVLFKTREAANTVIKKELNLRDRILRLSHAKPEAATSNNLTPSKRNMAGPKQSEYNKKSHNSPGGSDYQPKAKPNSLSYQGLRSSKSGVLKKAPREAVQLRSTAKGRTEPAKPETKSRSGKRPAVAARKAKALKRKFESGTSETSHKNKKAKHSK